MLLNLHVKNLALIEEADVDFSEGLIVLTGETGAGKSLLLGSINIALGNKFSKDIIRKGKEFALVEMTFSADDNVKRILFDNDISCEDNVVTVSRKISEGRSVSKINGETVNVATLKLVMENLVDIHGQHEHQSLLYKHKHLEILDKFAMAEIDSLLKDISEKYKEYTRLNNELDNFDMDENKRIRELEFAQYELNEIESAELLEGEDESLEAEYKKSFNGQKIIENLNGIQQITDENEGLKDLISKCILLINDVDAEDEQLIQLKEQIYNVEAFVQDLSRDVYDYAESYSFDPQRIKEIESRLDTINHLKLKYGKTIEEVNAYCDKQRLVVENLTNYEERLSALKKQIDILHHELTVLSEQLSKKRKEASLKLEKLIVDALNELNFLQVEFKIQINRKTNINEKGFDEIEFLISTNPGEPVKPLGKVASGGELSRIMLALKSILASEDDIGTLIFDEIDTGISGKTATMVANKLAKISSKRQVLCISHLAQIAAMADGHYLIEKSIVENDTYTNISKLTNEESVNELMRISSGDNISDSAYALAKEMKEMAEKTKKSQC